MRVIVTGPESSGKTTLVRDLSQAYKGKTIPEYARQYLEQHGMSYVTDNVYFMAMKQHQMSQKVKNATLIFEDTDLLNYLVWLDFKYDIFDKGICDLLTKNKGDLYLCCEPDLIWISDPLRENPNDRHILMKKYIDLCKLFSLNYRIISGIGRKRLNKAKFFMDEYICLRNFAEIGVPNKLNAG
ncbi:MAG: ATP-binding protein [Saprospiraceae bacterium]